MQFEGIWQFLLLNATFTVVIRPALWYAMKKYGSMQQQHLIGYLGLASICLDYYAKLNSAVA